MPDRCARHSLKTTRFTARIRLSRLNAIILLDGEINRYTFPLFSIVTFHKLLPENIAIMNNLFTHKADSAREIIQAKDLILLYFLHCSPDLNPIEMAFPMLQSLLRKATVRTFTALWNAIAQAIELIWHKDGNI
ncbi:MAG: transposase [Sodalis sp. (in: enterobacteria)]